MVIKASLTVLNFIVKIATVVRFLSGHHFGNENVTYIAGVGSEIWPEKRDILCFGGSGLI